MWKAVEKNVWLVSSSWNGSVPGFASLELKPPSISAMAILRQLTLRDATVPRRNEALCR